MTEEPRTEEQADIETLPDREEELPLDITLDETEPAKAPATAEPNLVVEIGSEEEPPPDDDRLVITADDLLTIPDTPAPPTVYPGLPSGVEYPGASDQVPAKVAPVAEMLGSVLWQIAVAGAIGGFLAWLCIEPFTNDATSGGGSAGTVLFDMGMFGAVVGGGIGLCLGAVEGIVGRVNEKAILGGLLGLGIGLVGGFLGGVVGQIIYAALGGASSGIFGQIAARTVGWAAVGICVGLGQGAASRSSRKILNGLLGGMIGGAIGGFLFDPIGALFSVGNASRAVAITVLGACAGAAIGMVEELAKQAWLRVTQGPLAGKEFILYHTGTTLGSSLKCEITIPKDPKILPQHGVIHNTGRGYSLDSLDERNPAFVNGRPARQTTLRDGDRITLGNTVLLYSERAVKNAGGPSYPAPPGGY